jgi:hypothetical protein
MIMQPKTFALRNYKLILTSTSVGSVIFIQIPAIYLPQSPEIVFGSAIITQEPKQNVFGSNWYSNRETGTENIVPKLIDTWSSDMVGLWAAKSNPQACPQASQISTD